MNFTCKRVINSNYATSVRCYKLFKQWATLEEGEKRLKTRTDRNISSDRDVLSNWPVDRQTCMSSVLRSIKARRIRDEHASFALHEPP